MTDRPTTPVGGFDGLNVRPRTLEERHNLLNQLFGFHPSAMPITRPTHDPSTGSSASASVAGSSTAGPRSAAGTGAQSGAGSHAGAGATSSTSLLPTTRLPEHNTRYRAPRTSFFGFAEGSLISAGNVVWVLAFGWWASALYAVLACVLALTWVGRYHAALLWHMARWTLWPFGRALERVPSIHDPPPSTGLLYSSIASTSASAAAPARASSSAATAARLDSGSGTEAGEDRKDAPEVSRQPLYGSVTSEVSVSGPPPIFSHELQWHNGPATSESPGVDVLLGTVLYYLIAFPLLAVVHVLIAGLAWMSIVMIPMAQLNYRCLRELYKNPLRLYVGDSPRPGAEIVTCTYQAANTRYFGYERFGVSVVLLNLTPFVFLTLILGYLGEHIIFLRPIAKPGVIFVFSLLSTIPIASVIGLAIASISAQSTFAVGATLNATFGSIIELILYAKLLLSGYSTIVKAGVTGSLLGCMLALPGLSMVMGGIKYKSQRFNATAAGVSSTLLLIAVTGAFAPTVFYATYGGYSLSCDSCSDARGSLACTGCTYIESALELQSDPVFRERARPLSYVCAALLPLAYFVGLLFTLKTHSHIYEAPLDDDEEEGEVAGHDAPAWSNIQCVGILLTATVVFALISETLVDSIEPILQSLGISELFLGISLIAVVPNTAEFISAVQFSLANNVMLSMEIGASASVQITLIQLPVLVFFSAIVGGSDDEIFTLVFPSLHLFAIFLSVLILNYNSLDGRASYFIGSAFLVAYAALLAMFYYVPPSASSVV